ncbi:hypothetical protein QUF64_04745 [Anaerolineales bacterium HSG6]|nr:hypothetical protein [Anaerolineales bacterium HSG6]MDM8531527.1 hypothetical protein [Anaerolineales bacterium HSG25]
MSRGVGTRRAVPRVLTPQWGCFISSVCLTLSLAWSSLWALSGWCGEWRIKNPPYFWALKTKTADYITTPLQEKTLPILTKRPV